MNNRADRPAFTTSNSKQLMINTVKNLAGFALLQHWREKQNHAFSYWMTDNLSSSKYVKLQSILTWIFTTKVIPNSMIHDTSLNHSSKESFSPPKEICSCK